MPSLAPGIRPGTSATVKRHVARLDHAEVRHERRERVVGDLGPGGGEGRDQARLAGAGEADERDVRDGLELQDDVERVARLAEQREAGRLAPRRGQRGVAQAAAAARGGDEPGAGADQVGQDVAVRALDDGAVGHRQDAGPRPSAPLRWPPCPALPLVARRCGAWW